MDPSPSTIEVNRLTKRFGETAGVDGISFRAAAGEVFGFLGPNGAGKSTKVKILCTLLEPTSGAARVAGHDVVRAPTEVRRALGLLLQNPSVDDRLTAREDLKLHAIPISNFVVLPLSFLSGGVFPVDRVPRWMAALIHVNSATYAVDLLLRHSMEQPVAFPAALDLAVLALFGGAMIAAALLWFRREYEARCSA